MKQVEENMWNLFQTACLFSQWGTLGYLAAHVTLLWVLTSQSSQGTHGLTVKLILFPQTSVLHGFSNPSLMSQKKNKVLGIFILSCSISLGSVSSGLREFQNRWLINIHVFKTEAPIHSIMAKNYCLRQTVRDLPRSDEALSFEDNCYCRDYGMVKTWK